MFHSYTNDVRFVHTEDTWMDIFLSSRTQRPGIEGNGHSQHFRFGSHGFINQVTFRPIQVLSSSWDGRPFVKRFDLCYWTVVLYVLSVVCNVGVLWRNGWMDQDEIWYGDRPQSRPHYVRWGSSSPHQKEAQLHNFRLMSIVAKRSPISATAELLYRPCTVLTCVCLCVCVCVLVCFSLCVIIVFFWLSYLPIQLTSCKSV